MRLARVLGAVGRTLITAGVLILLFVVYQLWGTGIRHAQSQERLADEFAEHLDSAEDDAPETTATTAPPDPASTTSTTAAPAPFPQMAQVPDGTAIANIRIPTIRVQETILEGASMADLNNSPGHLPAPPHPSTVAPAPPH